MGPRDFSFAISGLLSSLYSDMYKKPLNQSIYIGLVQNLDTTAD